MKQDARVRYTQKVLKEALLQLLEQKPVNRITVKEVCERAGLNRATFYTHYADCFDLLESIEQDLLQDFEASLRFADSFDMNKLIASIYQMIDRNEAICRVLIFEKRDAALLHRMIELAHEPSMAYWRAALKRAEESELEMLYTHLSNGLMHVVVEGYQKYDRDTVIRFVDRIVQSSFAAFR